MRHVTFSNLYVVLPRGRSSGIRVSPDVADASSRAAVAASAAAAAVAVTKAAAARAAAKIRRRAVRSAEVAADVSSNGAPSEYSNGNGERPTKKR